MLADAVHYLKMSPNLEDPLHLENMSMHFRMKGEVENRLHF